MKKKIFAAIAVIAALQGVAYAASSYSGQELSLVGINFRPSNNVKVFYFSDGQNYTIDGKHDAGDRTYSTSNKTSNIWYQVSTTLKAGVALTSGAAPATTVTGADASVYTPSAGWTAQ